MAEKTAKDKERLKKAEEDERTTDAEAPEEHDEEEQQEEAQDDDSDVRKLLEKSIMAIKVLNKRNQLLEKRLNAISKRVPPEMDVQWPSGKGNEAVDHDGTDVEVDEDIAPETSSRPAQDTTPVDGAFNQHPTKWAPAPKKITKGSEVRQMQKQEKGVDVEGMIKKAVDETKAAMKKEFDEQMPALIKAHTPLPFGYVDTPEAQLAARDPIAFIRKAIEVDRQNCGGAYSSVSEGLFGWKTGHGNNDARRETALYLKKALRT